MTRDEARALFSDSGMDWPSAVTKPAMRRLICLIDERMAAAGYMRGTFRMNARYHLHDSGLDNPWSALRCHAYYFADREAVTFNPDGFIGFAGWADEINVQPILQGFSDWCAELVSDAKAVVA